MKLVCAQKHEDVKAMEFIDSAKAHLKEQGIDQWQNGYPDLACIQEDIEKKNGFFLEDQGEFLGYMCIVFDGEPAYAGLQGSWLKDEDYVVVHRIALSDTYREKGLSHYVFDLVSDYAKSKGVHYFRIDTDEDNHKMKHILTKNGFTYRGTIWFDNSEKIAYDKEL